MPCSHFVFIAASSRARASATFPLRLLELRLRCADRVNHLLVLMHVPGVEADHRQIDGE
jgi:hypothetical protein